MPEDYDKDEFETTPSKTAIDARSEVLRRQQRAQEELVATNRRALREMRRAAAEEEDRPSVEVHNHIQIPSRRPSHDTSANSLPAANPLQVATKAGDTAVKAVRKLPPAWQVAVFLAVGAVALAAWLGWLDPPERLHKGVAPATATT